MPRPGVLLVTEAGGRVTDFKNKPWQFVKPRASARGGTPALPAGRPHRPAYGGSGARVDYRISLNVDLLATNGHIHKLILNHIEP